MVLPFGPSLFFEVVRLVGSHRAKPGCARGTTNRGRTSLTCELLGVWRSLVARSVRVGEVPSSNLGTPISLLLPRPASGSACRLAPLRVLLRPGRVACTVPLAYGRSMTRPETRGKAAWVRHSAATFFSLSLSS